VEHTRFSQFLPSKQFSIVLFSVLSAFGLILGAYYFKKTVPQKEVSLMNLPTLEAVDEAKVFLVKNYSELDSDNDALKDWEESLWGTDPKNPDTDQDGTMDGEEVKLGRNPTVKGPSDTLRDTLPAKLSKTEEEKLTPTDIVARDFFSKYVEAKQSGKELDEKTQGDIVSSVINRPGLITATAKLYRKNDISVSEDNSEKSLRAYGNAMGLIFKNTANWKEDEITIMQDAILKNNEKRLSDLDPVITGYQSILTQSLKVSVPSKAVDAYLMYINSLSSIVTSLKTMKETFKDPVSSLVFLGKYPEVITDLHRSFTEARSLFKRYNISFDLKNETGIFYANFADAIDASQKTATPTNTTP